MSSGYLKNVNLSIFYKSISIAIYFLMVPLLLKYIGDERFGIWIAFYSLISWVTFFDFGLGNSLRNALSENVANKEYDLARVVISSAYCSIGVIVGFFLVLVIFGTFFVDWSGFFNAKEVEEKEIYIFVIIFSITFLVNFLLSTVNQLFYATLEPSSVSFGQALNSIISIFFVFLSYNLFAPSLINLAIIFGGSQIISSFFLNLYFFKKNNLLIPSINYFSIKTSINIILSGGQFFIIQIAVLSIFASDKIIMVRLFDPVVVAKYEIVSRIYGAILIATGILISPLWSKYTHLKKLRKFVLMESILIKSNLIFIFALIVALLILFFKDLIISIWIGDKFSIEDEIFYAICFFISLRVWCEIYANFLNGIGVIKLQMRLAIFQAFINIPLSIYLGESLGPHGVVWASFITLTFSAILLPIQSFKEMQKMKRNKFKIESEI